MIVRRKKIYNIFEYAIALLLILNCNTVFMAHSLILKSLINVGFQVFLILFILLKANFNINRSDNHYFSLYLIILIIYSSIMFAFNFSKYNVNIILVNIFLDSVLFIYGFISDKSIDNSILYKFENISIVLAITSLIIWILVVTLHISPNMTISVTWGTPQSQNISGYFGLLFSPQSIYRNTGIFIEGTMYSYVLCMALFVELFVRCSNSNILNFRTIILVLAIISTISTTGIIISFPAILYRELISHKGLIRNILYCMLIPIVLGISHIALLNKIGNINDYDSSYNIRLNDISASIKAWEQHPIIGNGLTNTAYIHQYMYGFRQLFSGNSGLSTGFFTVLALGGILYSLFYVIPTILTLIACSWRIKGLAITNFILLIYTIVQNTYLCIFMFTYLFACYFVSTNKTRSNLENGDSV